MLTMIGKRLMFAIPSLIGVVIVTFLLTRALPGDPAAYFAEAIAKCRFTGRNPAGYPDGRHAQLNTKFQHPSSREIPNTQNSSCPHLLLRDFLSLRERIEVRAFREQLSQVATSCSPFANWMLELGIWRFQRQAAGLFLVHRNSRQDRRLDRPFFFLFLFSLIERRACRVH